ncbi:MAG: hypothetical protein ACKPKO_19325, partial [Candidatus Fonsibacter sp.]
MWQTGDRWTPTQYGGRQQASSGKQVTRTPYGGNQQASSALLVVIRVGVNAIICPTVDCLWWYICDFNGKQVAGIHKKKALRRYM